MTGSGLVPADRKRCQAEKPNPDYGPFRWGGSTAPLIRCDAHPTWIAKETRPGADGKQGAMSLCDSCKAVCEKRMAGAGLAFVPLKEVKTRAR